MARIEDELIQIIDFEYGSRKAFAQKIGVNPQTLYSAFRSGLAGSSIETVMPVLRELGLDPIAFADGKLVRASDRVGSVEVPLFGSIAAGAPVEPDTTNDTFPIPAKLHAAYPRAFMLRIRGTSMNRVMPDGSLALVDPCSEVEASGRIYAIAVGEGAATVKRVQLLSNGVALEPDSTDPTHHAIVLDYADADAPAASVIGRVVWYCPPLDWVG